MGISAFVPQALFCGETSGVGAKCQRSFQARFSGNSKSQRKSLSHHQRDDDY